MDILQLTYFCDAAESENFSHTARKFKVPTSSISQVIRRLEDDLGLSLFDRKGNRVFLNANGRIFYSRARTALDALEKARLQLMGDEETVRGEIRIFVGCNRAGVVRAIEQFRKKYPDVFFSLDHHVITDYNAYDLIISDHLDETGYESHLLLTDDFMVAVPADHPLAARQSVDMADFAGTRFMTMHEESSLSRQFYRLCRNAGFEPHVVIRCDDPTCLRRYVDMGLGAVVFPSLSWEGLFGENVVCLKLRTNATRETYVFRRADRTPTPAVRLFIQCLKETFGGAV